jgi:pyrimidine deaminase RibD-like protein
VLGDADYMERALMLAERGRGRTTPNPIVGAVIVSTDGNRAAIPAGRVPASNASSRPV